MLSVNESAGHEPANSVNRIWSCNPTFEKRIDVALRDLRLHVRPQTPEPTIKPGAENIRMFLKSDPPSTCKEFGNGTARYGAGCTMRYQPGTWYGTENGSMNQFKNKVHALGGNAALIIKAREPGLGDPECSHWNHDYVVIGVAYLCPANLLPAE